LKKDNTKLQDDKKQLEITKNEEINVLEEDIINKRLTIVNMVLSDNFAR